MVSHMKKQHIEKKYEKKDAIQTFYKCVICEMEYCDEMKLKTHLKTSHYITEPGGESYLCYQFADELLMLTSQDN